MSNSLPFLNLQMGDGGTGTPPDSPPRVAATSSPRAENNNLQESLEEFANEHRLLELPRDDEDVLLSFARVLIDEVDNRGYHTEADTTEDNKTLDHDTVMGTIKLALQNFVLNKIICLTDSDNVDSDMYRMASQIRSLLSLEDDSREMRDVVHSLYKIYQSKVERILERN